MLAALFLLTLCFSVPHRVRSESIGWYFKPAKDNVQPQCCPEASGFAKENGAIYLGNPDEKKIYLTFDAGYENGNVEKILNVLKEQNVPGAFFILPQIAKENTELVKRMKDEGHLVCNHTKSHRNMSGVTDFETFKAELCGLEDVVREKCGFEVDKYYRPPEGTFSPKLNLEMANRTRIQDGFLEVSHMDRLGRKQTNAARQGSFSLWNHACITAASHCFTRRQAQTPQLSKAL